MLVDVHGCLGYWIDEQSVVLDDQGQILVSLQLEFLRGQELAFFGIVDGSVVYELQIPFLKRFLFCFICLFVYLFLFFFFSGPFPTKVSKLVRLKGKPLALMALSKASLVTMSCSLRVSSFFNPLS